MISEKIISKIKGRENSNLSIRKKLLLSSISTLIVMAVIIGTVSTWTSYKSTKSTVEKVLMETAKSTAQRVDNKLEVYRELVNEISSNETFMYMTSNGSKEDKQKMRNKMNKEIKRIYKMHPEIYDMVIIGKDGKDIISGIDLSDREYVAETMRMKVALTNDVVINKEDNKAILVTSAPIMVNGDVQGVIGIITNANILSKVSRAISVGESSKTNIINASGVDIGNSEIDLVKEHYNVMEKVKEDKSLEGLAKVYEEMMAQKTGFQGYKIDGESRLMAYSPIKNTKGWSIGISVQESEFMQESMNGVILMVICTIIALALAIVITLRSSNNIVNPIIKCIDRIKLLSQGDLSSPVPTVNTNDETKVLVDATSDLVNNVSEIIQDIDYVLDAISKGDLTVTAQADYRGEFERIKNSSDNIIESLNEVMVEIVSASEQVSCGASQVSIGAQSLAQGSSEQASSVEELTATILDVSDKINSSSLNANKANEIVKETGVKMKDSNSQMREMMSAIELINIKSNEISKIIKTIDDIAFQTNILALNAAVEAARAGDAGKGFAVVADEVRNLSVKSAQAAKDTTVLIEETVSSINTGNNIAQNTAKSLEELVEDTNLVTGIVDKISSDLSDQATSVNQITQAIDQVNLVVQSNSATSEESAAASEELTGQSYAMNELISRFKLCSKDKSGPIEF